MVEEVPGDGVTGKERAEAFRGAKVSHVTFAYENEVILKDYSIDLKPGKVIGIHGASGSGKSTLLKLLMRFWDVNRGEIQVDGQPIKRIPTGKLRDMESYVPQETHREPPGRRSSKRQRRRRFTTLFKPCRMVMIQRSANWEIPCQAEKSRGSALPGLFSMMRPSCSSMSPLAIWIP